MKNVTRRDLLAWFGTGSALLMVQNPYSFIMTALKNALIQQAHAQAIGLTAKNYIVFLQYGAPPRWMWDGFLNPSGLEADFVANASVKNFVASANQSYSGISTEMEYRNGAAYNYKKGAIDKTIYMPALWDAKLPYHDGTNAVVDNNSPLMRSYLQNAMIIRGVSMGVDIGHVRGPELVVMPSSSKNSLTGSVAETNRGVLPALGLSGASRAYLGYKSTKQVSQAISRGGGSNGPLFDLFEPFVITQTGALISTNKANEALMESAMNTALAEMKEYAAARRPGSDVLFDTLGASENLFQQSQSVLLNLPSVFSTMKARYAAVIAQSKQAVPGLIPTPGDFTSHYDLFSSGFSVAEFMLANGFCSSFTMDCGSAPKLGNFLDDSGAKRSIGYYNDEHTVADRQISAMIHNFTNRSFMAAMHLFRQRIGESKWNNTVVQLSSEYGRTPRADGSGTDHSPGSNVYTLFSGAIKQFIPIGNITKNSAGQNPGTFGFKAPTQIDGIPAPISITKELAVNTVATLLGVPKIIDTADTLITSHPTQGWISKAEDPKNV